MLICIICLLSTGCNVYTSPKLLKTGANSISYNDESSTIDLLNNFLESDDFYRSFVFSNFYHKISYIKNKNVDFNLLLSRQDAENVLLKKYNSLSTNMSHSLRRIFLKDLLIHYYYKEFEETINSLRDVSIPVTPNGSIVNYYSMGEQLNSGDIESIRAIV